MPDRVTVLRSRRVAVGLALAGALAMSGCGSTSDQDADGGPVGFAVMRTVPEPGATQVPVDSPVLLELTEPAEAATMTIQPAWGACEDTPVQLSADGFATCVGGTIEWPEPHLLRLRAHHGVMSEGRTYQVRVAESVRSQDGVELETPYVQDPGFTTARPPCTAFNDPAPVDGLGEACVAPRFVDNGDGTVTDQNNKLLWAQCGLDADGALLTAPGGSGCESPVIPDDVVSWEQALAYCDDLTLAGRDDWVVPDLARLLTLLTDTGDPAIDTDYFPGASNFFYTASTTHPVYLFSKWSVLFGYMERRGTGYGGKLVQNNHMRCVAGPSAPAPPDLVPLEVGMVYTDRVTLRKPTFLAPPHPVPPKLAYVGPAATLEVSGTEVTGATEGPVELVGAGNHDFTGLSANTLYTFVVTAENAAGHDVERIDFRTGPVAPQLGHIELHEGTDGGPSVVLSPVSYQVVGNPEPTVHAWIGIEGVIAVDRDMVTGSLQGPVAVTEVGATFGGLDSGTRYGVVVIASNSAGYDVAAGSILVGGYEDHGDGTVTDPRTGLTWMKCIAGQGYEPDTGACTGDFDSYAYCNELDNDCNGGVDDGLLGPPFLAEGRYTPDPGESEAWDYCHYEAASDWGGEWGDWRVPTVGELQTLPTDAPDIFPPISIDPSLLSANSASQYDAHIVRIHNLEEHVRSKTEGTHLRCVRPTP